MQNCVLIILKLVTVDATKYVWQWCSSVCCLSWISGNILAWAQSRKLYASFIRRQSDCISDWHDHNGARNSIPVSLWKHISRNGSTRPSVIWWYDTLRKLPFGAYMFHALLQAYRSKLRTSNCNLMWFITEIHNQISMMLYRQNHTHNHHTGFRFPQWFIISPR